MGSTDFARLVAELKEKAIKVDWNRGGRKEHYLLITKRFRQR